MTKPNLADLRERFALQTDEDHVDCPLCGEGYPAGYPHGINDALPAILALLDIAEAASELDDTAAIYSETVEADPSAYDRLREALDKITNGPE